ncbi:hypothetical protein P7L68_02580 (plasmid) [Tistrella mobilis]|uniref:hypothetical protein n=1 Tax=Tistrella mobilis TaxID=171437 RepID=UPI0035587627
MPAIIPAGAPPMALIVSPNQLRDPVNNPGDFWNAVNGYLNAPAYFPPESVSVTAASVTLVRLDFDRTISLATDYVVDPGTGTLSNAVSFGRIWIVQRGSVQFGSASGDDVSRIVAATTSADPDVAGRDAADGASLVTYHLDASGLTAGTVRETVPNNGADPYDTSPTIVKTTTWYDDYVLLVEASPVTGAGDDARFLISEDNAAAERGLGSVWGAWLDGTAPFTPPTQTFGVYDAPVGWTVDENIYGDVFGIDGGVTVADGVISEDVSLVRQKLAYALREVGATSLENLLVDRGLTEAQSQAWRESIEADQAIVDALAGVSNAVIDTAVALVVALTDGVTPQETIDQLMQQIVAGHAAASTAAEAAVAVRLADPAFDGNAIPAGMTDAGLRSLIVQELLQATLRLMAYDGPAEYLHMNANPGYFANGRWDPSDLGRDAHGLVIGGAIGDGISGSGGIDLLIGGAGDDGLSGGGGDDRLAGGAGADRLAGGAGIDTASYADATSGVHVDLLSGRGALAEAEGDTLTGIESLDGGAFDDLLEGDTGANQLRGFDGDDVLRGRAGADHLDGGVGSDTVSYTDAAAQVHVNLANGSGTLGDAAGDTFVSIENVNGSNFNDLIEGDTGANQLRGFDGDDVLRGRAGADHLDGGVGSDTVSYTDAAAQVHVNLANGSGTLGDAAGDTFVSIENVNGSNFNDLIEGDAEANRLVGFDGDDVLRGRQGADFLDGQGGIDIATYSSSSAGVHVDLASGQGFGGEAEGDQLIAIENLNGSNLNDVLDGDTNVNRLIGFAGDDILRGRGGADLLDGRGGTDIATYSDSTEAVRIDLGIGLGSGGDAEGDRLISIENVNGSAFNDTLEGDGGANHFIGFAGDDTLRGRGGADILDGHDGIDVATYSTSTTGVHIDLALGQGFGGEAEGDRLISIEIVNGSMHDDTLEGGADDDTLRGFDGNDILRGRGGADVLDGRTGSDIATYSDSNAAVQVDLAYGTGTGGHAQGDQLISVEGVNGSAFDDVLQGSLSSDALRGFDGNDTLRGRDGNDILDGRNGKDVIVGGRGADLLLGGAGADRFVYSSITESTKTLSGRDTILDFSHTQGDRIDLSPVDANVTLSGNQTFTFIGTAAYSGTAGQVRYAITAEGTIVYADTDGDRISDMTILLNGNHALTAADFAL